MKALVIYNSKSKKKQFRNNLGTIVEKLIDYGYNCEVYATRKYQGCLEKIKSCKQIDLIVVSGGDGTIHEVTNGISFLKNKPRVIYCPSGTINDFAYSLKLSQNALTNLDLLKNGKLVDIDSGKINDIYFNYVAAFGAFTSSSYRTNSDMKNLFGPLAYALDSIKDFAKITESYHLKITLENEIIEGNYALGFIANANSIGGFRTFFKEADMQDGLFQLLLVPAAGVEIFFKSLSFMIAGVNDVVNSDSRYIYRVFKKISIECDEKLAWTIDGEEGIKGSCVIENIPQNLQIYVPKKLKTKELL